MESAWETESIPTAAVLSTASLTVTVDHYTHLFQTYGTRSATVAFECAIVSVRGTIINHMSLTTLRLYLLSKMFCLVVVSDMSELGFAY